MAMAFSRLHPICSNACCTYTIASSQISVDDFPARVHHRIFWCAQDMGYSPIYCSLDPDYGCNGGGGVFLGWIRNAPGALQNITVYVMWPLVFLVFIAGIGKNLGLIEGMLKVMILATLVSSLITLRIIVITGDPWLISRLIPVIAPDFDYGRFQRYPVNTLIFLLPFVMTATLLWTKQWERIGWYGWFLIATFFGLAAAVAWNRRALWAIVVLAPLIGAKIAYGFASRTQPKLSTVSLRVVKVLIVGIVSLLILFFFWHDNFDALIQRFSNIFMLEIFDENSDLIRQQQLETLFVGWLRHPLFGTGFGAAIPGPLRSEEMPWASELSYFLLLYNTGIIGFLVYSSGVAWIIWTGIRVARSWRDPGRFMVPLLTGMVCFLIANVSNPYLAKYDYMWTLFLPIACINYWLLTECTPENRNR